jgi:hypothetical protein
MIKLVTKIPWNSFASVSVSPESEPRFSSAMLSHLHTKGLAAMIALFGARLIMPLRFLRPAATRCPPEEFGQIS